MVNLDGVQGLEFEVVVISPVRASGELQMEFAESDFVMKPGRLNTAMSRTRSLLVVVGNRAQLERNCSWWRSVTIHAATDWNRAPTIARQIQQNQSDTSTINKLLSSLQQSIFSLSRSEFDRSPEAARLVYNVTTDIQHFEGWLRGSNFQSQLLQLQQQQPEKPTARPTAKSQMSQKSKPRIPFIKPSPLPTTANSECKSDTRGKVPATRQKKKPQPNHLPEEKKQLEQDLLGRIFDFERELDIPHDERGNDLVPWKEGLQLCKVCMCGVCSCVSVQGVYEYMYVCRRNPSRTSAEYYV